MFNLGVIFNMKKTLVAMAALAVVGAASAQSVTLYGAVDASYNYMAASGGLTASKLANSQYGSSKLGFKGEEDLGGGLKAVFKLEGGLANDSGNGKASNTNNQPSGNAASAQNGAQGLDFQRYSYVGVLGGFGEVHLGREYISSFQHGQGSVDVFGTNGPADATNMFYKLGNGKPATNMSNMVTYTTPNMGGFTGGLQYFMGENTQGPAGANDNGSGYSIYADYTAGPLFITGAQSVQKAASTATDGDYLVRALGASYNFGIATVVYTYSHEESANSTTTPKNDTNLIGVSYPMGAATFKASYIHAALNMDNGSGDVTGDLIGLGVDYALSKRTTVYATFATVKNNDGASAFSTGLASGVNGTSDNLAVGIYHKF
jgi:predicted porin